MRVGAVTLRELSVPTVLSNKAVPVDTVKSLAPLTVEAKMVVELPSVVKVLEPPVRETGE